MSDTKTKTLRTEAGAPVADNQRSQTAGPRGPLLLQDQHLLEKLARFNRERIPERVVHAVGSGAYGHFKVTNAMSEFTRAHFLAEAGRETEVLLRFSTVAGSRGAPDTVRDPRGFALKFYTAEGNYDLAGNNTPVFFLRDPIKFPDFIHSQKQDPKTNAPSAFSVWDFFSRTPEATHQFTWLFGDRGRPTSYRRVNGYGSHTFQWVNAEGVRHWVKYHFKNDAGCENFLDDAAADKIGGADPQHSQQDLFNAIERGDFPTWTLKVQLMPEEDAETYRINPFDVTRVWPHADYPLIDVGTLTLNRNPENYFAEVEQAAFDPGHFVPGIGPSPDRMLQGRLFAYGDAHRYRLGINHTQLEVNRPKGLDETVGNYGRDGTMASASHTGGGPNYEPNGRGGPKQTGQALYSGLASSGVTGTWDQEERDCDDFEQAGGLYRVMGPEEQARLIARIAGGLAQVDDAEIRERSVSYFAKADPEYGKRLKEAIATLRG